MKANVNPNVNSKTTNVSGWRGKWDKKFCFDDSFEGGKLYKSKDKAKDAKQFIESLLSKQRAELVEKLQPKVYGYDDSEGSGYLEWKDVLTLMEE